MQIKSSQPGIVITFYSYKGGTGRSMALANTACLLAKRFAGSSQKILVLDWDLEAPGLHRFFAETTEQPENVSCPGIIDYFRKLRDLLDQNQDLCDAVAGEEGWKILDKELPIAEYIISDIVQGADLIKAGRYDTQYPRSVSSFNWPDFYNKFGFVFQAFNELITYKYAYCLVDSRTGATDISGICTMLLPEKLVGVFTPNRQSLYGLLELVERAVEYRSKSNDFRPLAVFPLPSRIDDAEHALRQEWREEYQHKFEEMFRRIYEVEECNLTEYLDEVQLPHKSYYAYGEKIAVLEERSEALSLSRIYENIFKYLVNMDHSWQTFQHPTDDMADRKSFLPGFRHDIFISYARIDNEPVPGVEEGWVSTLVKGIRTLLAQKLGKKDAFSLWMDTSSLSSRNPVTSEIEEILRKTAILVVIMSPGYLTSTWCQQEREIFFDAIGKQTGRVFIVEYIETRYNEKPESLRELSGYRFWVQDGESRSPRTLGYPVPNPRDSRHHLYYERLHDLASGLTEELIRIKSRSEAGSEDRPTRT